jgi:hypothetical protein
MGRQYAKAEIQIPLWTPSLLTRSQLEALLAAGLNFYPSRLPISSPAVFSKLKYERETKLQEKQEQTAQAAQQRVSLC